MPFRFVTALLVASLMACRSEPSGREQTATARTPLAHHTPELAANEARAAPAPAWQPPPGLSLWNIWFNGGDQVEGYSTLAAMYEAADRVVLARFEELLVDEVAGHDEAKVVMARLRVRVTRTLRSSDDSRSSLALLFMVAVTREREARALVAAVRDHLPPGEMLLFLRSNLGHFGEDNGTVRLVCYAGLWTDEPDGVYAPLIAGGEDDARYASELRGVKTVLDLGTRLSGRSSARLVLP